MLPQTQPATAVVHIQATLWIFICPCNNLRLPRNILSSQGKWRALFYRKAQPNQKGNTLAAITVFNRPGVAWGYSTSTFLIN